MAKIELYFGNPTSEKVDRENEQWAFNRESSLEKANIELFKTVMGVLARQDENDKTYFDFVFESISSQELIFPMITNSTYTYNKTKYPKLIINGDYLVNRESNIEIFISDEWINKIGKSIEDDFDYLNWT